jgi:hypothetical protein
MRTALRVFALIAAVILAASPRLASAQPAPPVQPVVPPAQQQPGFTPGELVNAGHHFFGTVSRGLATVIEQAVSQWLRAGRGGRRRAGHPGDLPAIRRN